MDKKDRLKTRKRDEAEKKAERCKTSRSTAGAMTRSIDGGNRFEVTFAKIHGSSKEQRHLTRVSDGDKIVRSKV